jgi:hypothetical protein
MIDYLLQLISRLRPADQLEMAGQALVELSQNKVVLKSTPGSGKARREFAILSYLKGIGASVPTPLEVGDEWFSMEYVQGINLDLWLSHIRGNSEWETATLHAVLKAYQSLGDTAHLDLHGKNLMVTVEGGSLVVYVVDFGEAFCPAIESSLDYKAMIPNRIPSKKLDVVGIQITIKMGLGGVPQWFKEGL